MKKEREIPVKLGLRDTAVRVETCRKVVNCLISAIAMDVRGCGFGLLARELGLQELELSQRPKQPLRCGMGTRKWGAPNSKVKVAARSQNNGAPRKVRSKSLLALKRVFVKLISLTMQLLA